MNNEFQVSEIFPTLIIKNDLSECITDDVIDVVDNVIENMSEEIPLSDAFSSRREMNTLLDNTKLSDLREYILNSILKFTLQQYQLHMFDIVESYAISVPEGGNYEIRKNYNTSFHLLINLSSSTEIVLHNPIYFTKSFEYQVETLNKYNSQYSVIPFNKNESMMIPSGMFYGFPKRDKELKFITAVIR